jgi:hypothetical protein
MSGSSQSPDTTAPVGPRALAGGVFVGGLGLWLAALSDGDWRAGVAPAPYGWRDVAIVHLLCALPLALMLTAFVRARVPSAGAVAIAVGCLTLGFVPLLEDLRPAVTSALGSGPPAGYTLRAVPALGVALGVMLVASALAGFRPSSVPRVGWRPAFALGLLGAVALVLPPATYVGARCRHDAAKLGELLEQSRFGEARVLVRGLLVLDPGRTWNGHPLPEVAERIERVVAELESRVAVPMRPYPTTRERLDRARALAMLGRTDEALGVLKPVDDPLWQPDVENLRGTIHETRGDWESGLTAYRAAHAAWERRPESPARAAGQLRATTGTAYCLRKLGRYDEAEGAYQELLSRSPTAETHFLLAQFYDDAQQAAKAREHARRAIDLAPDRYKQDGENLIRKLSVYQFGCWGVFEAEGSGTAPGGSDGGLDRIR